MHHTMQIKVHPTAYRLRNFWVCRLRNAGFSLGLESEIVVEREGLMFYRSLSQDISTGGNCAQI